MAEKVARPRVEFNGKQIESQIEAITNQTKEWRKELLAAKKAGDQVTMDKLKKSIDGAETEVKQLTRDMFKVDNVIKDINGTSFTNLKKAFIQQSKLVRGLRKDAADYNEQLGKQKLLKNAMANFNGDLAKQQGLFKRAANGFNNYFGIITAGLASLTGIGLTVRKAVDMANIREEVVDDLQALTGLGDATVAELEKTAAKTATTIDESGVRIKQSADDIVNAYKLVGSQRAELLKNSDALHAVTKDAIILSEAAKGELEPSARALTNTLNQFQQSADQSRRIINILAAGSQAGAGDISYLSKAIEKTGTSANLMGISIEETVGTIEAIAPFFSEASMAGNSFDKVLLKLKAKQIGYKDGVFDLNRAIDELREMYESGTSSVDVFGAEHAKLGELLVQNQGEINRYTAAVTGTQKAIEQATINTSNNAAALAQAKNRSKEIAIELGKRLQPAMTAMHVSGTHLLKTIMALIDFFGKYGKQILWTAAAIGTYTATIKLQHYWNDKLYPLYQKVSQAVKSYAKNQQGLSQALKPNIFAAAATAIVLVVAALVKLSREAIKARISTKEFNQELEKERTKVNDLFEALKKTNPESEERNKIVKKLNDQYPELLKNYDLDKAGLEEIEKAQKKVNNEILRGIAARMMEADIEKVTEKASKKAGKALTNILDLTKNYEIKGMATALIEDLVSGLKDGSTDLKDATDKVADLLNIPKMILTGSQYGVSEQLNPEFAAIERNLKRLLKYDDQLVTAKNNIKAYYDALTKATEEPIFNTDGSVIIDEADLLPDPVVVEDIVEDINTIIKTKEENLQEALLKLREQYGLVSQYELYLLELKELDSHLARKLLSEEEYQKARQAIYNKYLKTPDIQEEESDFDVPELEPSVNSQRWESELDYQNQQYAQSLDYQYELLWAQWERGEVGWTEYYDRLNALDNEHTRIVLDNLVSGFEHAANLSGSVTSIISSNLEMQKQKELAAAGDSAEKREEIELKYRKKQKELALKQAYIDASLAILKAVASAPWPINIPAIIEATGAGIAAIASIKAQEYYVGGYTGFDGAPTDVAGTVHKKEFVANAQATANPSVKGVLDIINLAQKNGSISRLDLPGAIYSMNATRGFAAGGYASTTTSAPSGPVSQNTGSDFEKAAFYIYEAAKIFASKNLVITADAVKKIAEAGYDYEVQKSSGSRV